MTLKEELPAEAIDKMKTRFTWKDLETANGARDVPARSIVKVNVGRGQVEAPLCGRSLLRAGTSRAPFSIENQKCCARGRARSDPCACLLSNFSLLRRHEPSSIS